MSIYIIYITALCVLRRHTQACASACMHVCVHAYHVYACMRVCVCACVHARMYCTILNTDINIDFHSVFQNIQAMFASAAPGHPPAHFDSALTT